MDTADTASARGRFRVVLVEPTDGRNVGAVARAMTNLGFRDLRLVAPHPYAREAAATVARGGAGLLDTLTIHEHWEEAVADADEIVGLSGRDRWDRAHAVTLPEWSAGRATRPAPRTTALLFGTERDGLPQDVLDRCRWIVRIPTAADAPNGGSFNLAQAVLVVLYELTRALPAPDLAEPTALSDRPTGADFDPLDRLLDSVMRRSGFARPGTPQPAPGTLRALLRRCDPDRRELGLLLGLLGRIDRTLARSEPNEPTAPD